MASQFLALDRVNLYLGADPGATLDMLAICPDGGMSVLASVPIPDEGHGASADDRGNVWSPARTRSPLAAFDLGLYRPGEARTYTFTQEGIVRLGCNVHANMSAYMQWFSAPA